MSNLPTSVRDERRGAVQYLLAIRQHWLLVAIIVASSVGSAFVFVTTSARRYEASIDIVVSPVSAGDDTFQGLSVFRQSLDGSSTVVTAARVFNSPEIRILANKAMGSQLAAASSIRIDPVSQADVLAITATAPTAAQATKAANVFATTSLRVRTAVFQAGLRQQVARLEQRVAAIPQSLRAANFEYAALEQRLGALKSYIGVADPTLRIIAAATLPNSPSWPRPKLTLGAAFLSSLLLGCALAVLLEVANPRISREEELLLSQRLPILTRIPRLPARVVHGYLVGKEPLPGAAWKGYRTLRAALATAGPEGTFPRSILVTSATPGDGKTMTAVNLAITLAASDMRVVLVDADLHRPMIATIFQVVARSNGVGAVLAGRISPEAALVPAPAHPRLELLLAQREHAAQVQLFDATRLRNAIMRMADKADVVVVDSPPVTEVAEALELAAAVDTVLLTVRLGHTRRDRLNQLREMLARRGVSPVGFVVTTSRGAQSDSPYGYAGDLANEPRQLARPDDRRTTVVRLQGK